MKIQVHYSRLDDEIFLNPDARAYIKKKLGTVTREYFGVQVVESRRGEMAVPQIIPVDRGLRSDLDYWLWRLEKERKTMSLAEVAMLGEVLARILFDGTVRDMLVRCIDYAEDRNEGLRLRLVLKDTEAARIPWEYVYLQRIPGTLATWSGFLALDPRISLVRHEPMQITSRHAALERRPLKVYLGFAQPDGIGEDLDEESIQVNVEEALRDEIEAGRIALTTRHQLQVKHLDEVAGYGIFSFSGHGAFMTQEDLAYYRNKYQVPEDDEQAEAPTEAEETARQGADRAVLRAGFARWRSHHPTSANPEADPVEAAPNPYAARRYADREVLRAGFERRRQKQAAYTQSDSSEGVLLFEKEGRYPHFYPATNLAHRLKRAGVSVVVMDSCYSSKTDSKYKWTGLASAMLRVGIPAAVGMQYGFSDPAAREFWTGFYRAIAGGASLDEAVSAGRLGIIDLEPEPDPNDPEVMLTGQNDFGFPALYMRYTDGPLFPEIMENRGREAGSRPDPSERPSPPRPFGAQALEAS